jgi:hypothetical protein
MAKSRPPKLDEFHWHEALDRAYLAFEFFNERVADHAAVQSKPELKRDAEEIADRMFRLYQSLGATTLDRPKKRR